MKANHLHFVLELAKLFQKIFLSFLNRFASISRFAPDNDDDIHPFCRCQNLFQNSLFDFILQALPAVHSRKDIDDLRRAKTIRYRLFSTYIVVGSTSIPSE
ncbi:hypothetical protein SATMO3_55530 [Sporomusa aerivorans]